MKRLLSSVLFMLMAPAAYAGFYDGLDTWAVTSDTTTRTVSGGFAVAASSKTHRVFTTRIDGTSGYTSSKQITASSGTFSGQVGAASFKGSGAYLTGLSTETIKAQADAIAVSTGVLAGRDNFFAAAFSTAVFTTGSYENPAWITSLASSKIDFSTITAALSGKLDTNGSAAGLTNIPAAQLTGAIPAGSVDLSTVTANHILKTGGTMTGNLIVGASVQANILQTNTIYPTGTLSITGNANYHYTDIGVAGLMVGGVEVISQARAFTGAATGLTNIPAAQLTGGVPSELINLSTVTTALAGKQATGNYITALTGNVTATGPGSVTATIASLPAISGASLTNLTAANISAGTAGISISGNAGTATALAADPSDCSLPNVALGVNASGAANCGQPSNVTGTAANITGNLAASQIAAGTAGINISGNAATVSGMTIDNAQDNIAIGNGTSLGPPVSTSENTIIGESAGELITSGAIGNTFVGSLAGSDVTTGSYNIFIGYNTPGTSADDHMLRIGSGIYGPLTVNSTMTFVPAISAPKYYGDGSALTGISAGGVSRSTETFRLSTDGDVFLASTTFAPILGVFRAVDYSTLTITGVRCYTIAASTVSPTSFNIARSTDTGATQGWSYLFTSSVTVNQNEQFSAWVTPDANADVSILPAKFALHVLGIPSKGTLPSGYGCIVRYWREL